MKKLLVIFSLLISTISFADVSFNDIKGDEWFYDNVKILVEKNVINGYEDNTFRPNGNITRAEFIKMFVDLSNNNEIGISVDSVRDNLKLDNGKWYDKFVDAAIKKGLILGNESEIKVNELNNPITRKEIAILISRSLKDEIKDTEVKLTDTADKNILKVYSNGIITGYEDRTFRENKTATRAEAVTMINRYIDPSKRVVNKSDDKNIQSKKDTTNLPAYLRPENIGDVSKNKPVTPEQIAKWEKMVATEKNETIKGIMERHIEYRKKYGQNLWLTYLDGEHPKTKNTQEYIKGVGWGEYKSELPHLEKHSVAIEVFDPIKNDYDLVQFREDGHLSTYYEPAKSIAKHTTLPPEEIEKFKKEHPNFKIIWH